MNDYSFGLGLIFGVLIMCLLIMALFFGWSSKQTIDNTVEDFCESYGLQYEGFEKIDIKNELRIQFNCFNETATKVDGIGRLVNVTP